MAEGKWIATTNLDWSCCVNRIPCFNRRFSAGFGSRDYRTSTSGSGGSTRPGGSVGGPRTSGGGSYPNYSAPPPTHGTKQKKETKLLGYTFGSNPSVFFVTFRCCCLLHASLFLLLMRPVRKQQKKKITKTFPSPLDFQLSLLGFVACFIHFSDCLERKNIQRVQGVHFISKRSAPTDL